MLKKDKNEDLILIDNYIIIKGISSHLMTKFNIEKNNYLKFIIFPFMQFVLNL